MNVSQSATLKDIEFIIDALLYQNITKLLIVITRADTVSQEQLDEVITYTKTSIERLQQKKTRLVMTSGGNEQVADGIGNSKNSVFAEPLIKALKDNNSVIRSIELFQTVQNYVINNADQTPNHSLIHGTGHNGGEFLFFPKS